MFYIARAIQAPNHIHVSSFPTPSNATAFLPETVLSHQNKDSGSSRSDLPGVCVILWPAALDSDLGSRAVMHFPSLRRK
jgi:hypothetical protein